MTKNKKNINFLPFILCIVFTIDFFIELLCQTLAISLPIVFFLNIWQTQNWFLITTTMVFGLYFYAFILLFIVFLLIRTIPKPNFGYIKNGGDALKFHLLTVLSLFIRRTTAQWFMTLPFPGYFFYKIAGAKIHSSVIMSSPDSLPDMYFVTIGKNTLLGLRSTIFCHYSSGHNKMLIGPVEIGEEVLIGLDAVIWANVKIGSRSIIQNKSVVMPGTIIPPDEVWGGVPAQKLREVKPSTQNSTDKTKINISEIESHIRDICLSMYQIEFLDKDVSLVSLGLSTKDITYILQKMEKTYDFFIDRTMIDIINFSFRDMLNIIENVILKSRNEKKVN